YAARDHVLQRVIETSHLLLGQRHDATLGMKPRLPEDLVRVCVPDPGEEPLVLEEVSDLTARRTRAFRELAPVPWKFAGLRSELVETVHRARVLSLVLDVPLAHPPVVAIAASLPVI